MDKKNSYTKKIIWGQSYTDNTMNDDIDEIGIEEENNSNFTDFDINFSY